MIGFKCKQEQDDIIRFVRNIVNTEIKPLAWEMDARGDDTFDYTLLNILSKYNLTAPEH